MCDNEGFTALSYFEETVIEKQLMSFELCQTVHICGTFISLKPHAVHLDL